jgi:hypothetical protein
MKLAGTLANGSAVSDLQDIRDLSAEELKHHALYKSVVAEAKNRLTLFRVLDDNHREWAAYLTSLLHPGEVNDDAVVLELERLFLNYLTCANHIRLHFEGSFQQRFRTDGAEQKKYKMLLEQLIQTSWVFAFFLDFRNYLQNQGLGLGFYKRKLTPLSVSLELTLNSVELLNTTKDWPRSKLAPAKGILELTGLLRDFHAQMMQKYSGIVIATLFADLPPATEFYKKLASEVRTKDPHLTMVFRDGETKIVYVPNDLMAELALNGVVRK